MKLIFLLLTTVILCRVVTKTPDGKGGYIYTVVKLRPPYVPEKTDTGKMYTSRNLKIGEIIKFE